MFLPIPSSSANKEKIVNENFLFQEAFNRGVIARTLTDPPLSPSSDGVYIPAATATGAWAGKENQLLWWNPDGYWRAIAPKEGMKLFTQIEGEIAIEYSGGAWQAIAVTPGSGGNANLGILGDEARNLIIVSATETEPLVGVDEGTAVIVGTGATATGDWAGLEGQYVRYENGSWVAYSGVKPGTVVYCFTDEKFYYFSQFGIWNAIPIAPSNNSSNKILPVPKNFWAFEGNLVDVQAGKHLTEESNTGLAVLGTHYTFVPGKFGQAIQFISGRLVTNNSYDLVVGGEFSISAWISRRGRIKFYYYSLDSQGNSESYYLDLIAHLYSSSVDIWFNSHEYKWVASTSISESSTSYNSQSGLYNTAEGEYRHIVIVREYNNTDCLTRYYIDGNIIGTDINVNALTAGNTKVFKQINAGSKFGDFPGYIDNFRVYDRALSAEEVVMLANE